MAINLLDIKPNVISRDLSGYITYIYGAPKVGKTSFGVRMPKHLILGFERGTNALPGAMVQPINSWGELKQVVRELKKPEVQETYKSLIIDTADIASDMCQKYICSQLGIENIGDGGWSNNGWAKYKKEFEETFRTLSMLGYAIVFISHVKESTQKEKSGAEYLAIRPSIQSSALAILENLADIYGYAHQVQREDGTQAVVLTLRAPAGQNIACGSRFKYIAPEIEFSYDSLTKALNDAIDAEAAHNDNKYITEERVTYKADQTYDYDALVSEFETLVGQLMTKDQGYYTPRITQIIDKYLGKGKKVSQTTRDQAELIYLIVDEIKSELM